MNGSAKHSFAETNRDFKESFDKFVAFVSASEEMSKIASVRVREHFLHFIKLNCNGGKCIRGSIVLHFYRMLVKETDSSFIPFIVGWCVEMLQCVFLVLDDIMDNSTSRRGAPCWYTRENVGMMAINDAFMLENYIYQILRFSLSNDSEYFSISEAFKKTSYMTSLGQSYDMHACQAAKQRQKDFSSFNDAYYAELVKHKTSYYTLVLPFLCGVILSKFDYKQCWSECERFLLHLGFLFQAQDDYFDCFADPSVIGKDGGDIYEGKCTFLAVHLLKSNILLDDLLEFQYNYGIENANCQNNIKNLYKKYKLDEFFETFIKTEFEKLKTTSEKIYQNTNQKIDTKSLLEFVLNRKF